MKSDKREGGVMKLREPLHVLYGHHNEITAIYLEETLGLITSCDKVLVKLFEGLLTCDRIEWY